MISIVRYGTSGPPKNTGPLPHSPPGPLTALWRGILFSFPCPCLGPELYPADRALSNLGREEKGLGQGMSGVGPQTGWARDNQLNIILPRVPAGPESANPAHPAP